MMGYDDIRIGVLEANLPALASTRNSINLRYTNGTTSYHADSVVSIILAFAPYAEIYLTSYDQAPEGEQTLLNQLEWFLTPNRNVNIINISMDVEWRGGVDDNPGEGSAQYFGEIGNTYGVISEILDRIISLYDVTIVQAAGNEFGEESYSDDQGIVSGGMAYNSIVVGNYHDANNAREYKSSYNIGTQYASKPDLCAPGLYVFDHNGITEYASGTSLAAPAVTGIVALLMARDLDLIAAPELVKAILTAGVSTETVHRYGTDDANYTMYGAGVVNAANAYEILTDGTYISSSMSANGAEFEEMMFLVTSQNTRIVFNYLHKTLETNISQLNHNPWHTAGNVTVAFRSMPSHSSLVDFYFGDAKTIFIADFVSTITGMQAIKVESFYGQYSEEDPYSVPYAVAWRQW